MTEEKKSAIALSAGRLAPIDHAELWRICEKIADARLCPEQLRKSAADVFLVASYGASLGFDPMVALQNGYVVKGHVRWPGEMILAAIQSHPLCEYVTWEFTGSVQERTRTVTILSKRKDRDIEEPAAVYGLQDAIDAELYPGKPDKYGNPPVWSKSPNDMLFWKAVARLGRRSWGFATKKAAMIEDYVGVSEPEPPREVVDVTPRTDVEPGRDPAQKLLERPGLTGPTTVEMPPGSEPLPAGGLRVAPTPEESQLGAAVDHEKAHEGEGRLMGGPGHRCGACTNPIRRNHPMVTVAGVDYHAGHAPVGPTGNGGEAPPGAPASEPGEAVSEPAPEPSPPTEGFDPEDGANAPEPEDGAGEAIPGDAALEAGAISPEQLAQLLDGLKTRAGMFRNPRDARRFIAEAACELAGIPMPWNEERMALIPADGFEEVRVFLLNAKAEA